jgi:phospholipid/cholesterol/gamma-HCH transport system substrate-binding protein
MNEQTMRFRLGLFVLAALTLLAVLIMLFGRFANFFQRLGHYTVVLDNAPGVAAGTPVRRSGVPIGRVKSIKLDDETGKVWVEIEIEAKCGLRHSDQPTLVHGLLGGDASIDFLPLRIQGKLADRSPVAEGETLEGVVQVNVSSLVDRTATVVPPARDSFEDLSKILQALAKMTPLMEATLREYRDLATATHAMIPEWRGVAKASREMIPELQELAKQTRKTIPELRRTGEEIRLAALHWGGLGERIGTFLQTNEDKLQKSLDHLNKTLGGMASVFTEENQRNLARSFSGMANVFCDENQRNMSNTLKNVRAGSDHLQTISKNTQELIDESRQTIRRVNDTVRLADQVLETMDKITKPLPERTERVMRNLDESTDKLNRSLSDVRELFRSVAGTDGSLRRFLNDPSLYTHLDDAACIMTRLLPRMDLILRDMAVFADKLARHPEALGLGGLVRPSSGLKEAPTSSFYGRGIGH